MLAPSPIFLLNVFQFSYVMNYNIFLTSTQFAGIGIQSYNQPCSFVITIHNLGKITPSVTPAACHLPQRGRRIMAPSLRGLSA